MRKTGPTNIYVKSLSKELRKKTYVEDVNIWKALALELERPNRNKRIVNLAKLDKFTKENDVIVVPGKILASGNINHKITVSSFSISASALDKLKNAGCDYMALPDMVNKNPKGKNIRIIG